MFLSLNTIENLYYKRNFSKEKGLGHPDALWKEIEHRIDKHANPNLNINVKTVMDTWTKTAGYPVVSIAINDNGVLTFTQERFLLRKLDKTTKTDRTWSVPLTFATESKPDFTNTMPKFWLSTDRSVADFKIDPKEWIIFNIQSSGWYRTVFLIAQK